MRFSCDQCNAQYAIADEKVGSRGVRVRCKKCGNIITVLPPEKQQQDAFAENTTIDRQQEQQEDRGPGEDAGFQQPDEEGRSASTDVGFDDSDIGNALDAMFGGESSEGQSGGLDEFPGDEEDDDLDRQATRVFSMEEMQQVEQEREMAQSVQQAGTPVEEPQQREWYAAVDEQQLGPMTLSELSEKLGSGELDEDTLVWKAGFADWMPIGEVDELRPLLVGAAADNGEAEAFSSTPGEQPEEDEDEATQIADARQFQFGDYGDEYDEGSEEEDAYSEGEYSGADGFGGGGSEALAAVDVDWQPSAISEIEKLAESELAALRPQDPEPEPDSELEQMLGGDEEAEPSGEEEMDDGDSSLIRQIAEEESKKAQEAELQAELERQQAAEQERKEQERQEQQAPVQPVPEPQPAPAPAADPSRPQMAAVQPPQYVSQPPGKQPLPWWAWGLFGMGGVLIILLGVLVYRLTTAPAVPVVPAANVAVPVQQPVPAPNGAAPIATGVGQKGAANMQVPAGQPAGVKVASVQNQPGPAAPDATDQQKPGPGAATGATTAEGPKQAEAQPVKKPEKAAPSAKPVKKRGVRKPQRKKVVAKKTERKQPPAPEPERKPPRRKKSSSSDLLDFEDRQALARETGIESPPPTASKPKKKQLPPLSNADVLGVMRQHLPEFKACNRKQKELDRSVRGKMVVKFVIMNNGRVGKVSVVTPEFRNTYVGKCVSNTIRQMRFPEFGGPPKTVPFPFSVK